MAPVIGDPRENAIAIVSLSVCVSATRLDGMRNACVCVCVLCFQETILWRCLTTTTV